MPKTYKNKTYTNPLVTSHPEHMRDFFDEIRKLRPDIKSNSRASQEAVKHYLAYLKSGRDPLVGVFGGGHPGTEPGRAVADSVASGSNKMSEAWFDHGTGIDGSAASEIGLSLQPVYTAWEGSLTGAGEAVLLGVTA